MQSENDVGTAAPRFDELPRVNCGVSAGVEAVHTREAARRCMHGADSRSIDFHDVAGTRSKRYMKQASRTLVSTTSQIEKTLSSSTLEPQHRHHADDEERSGRRLQERHPGGDLKNILLQQLFQLECGWCALDVLLASGLQGICHLGCTTHLRAQASTGCVPGTGPGPGPSCIWWVISV